MRAHSAVHQNSGSFPRIFLTALARSLSTTSPVRAMEVWAEPILLDGMRRKQPSWPLSARTGRTAIHGTQNDGRAATCSASQRRYGSKQAVPTWKRGFAFCILWRSLVANDQRSDINDNTRQRVAPKCRA